LPELPEVETVRVALEPLLTDRRIERAEVFDYRLTLPEPPEAVAQELAGERIVEVGRRGKYLLLRFESGRVLLIHLRMTGSLRGARCSSSTTAPPSPSATSAVSGPGCCSTRRTSSRTSPGGSAWIRSTGASTWRGSPAAARQ
jgi:formamidopyrimidine-DNA glycosylase